MYSYCMKYVYYDNHFTSLVLKREKQMFATK